MKKNYTKWAVLGLVAAVLFISVGYAAYSRVLDITGVAKVNKSIWSVHYDKDSIEVATGSINGYALVNPTNGPSVNDDMTSLSFETELSINEETNFTVDVINDGTFNARVSSVNLSVDGKKVTDANYSSLAKVASNRWSNEYLDFYVVWTEGNKNILDTVDLEPGTTKNMKVVVRYKEPVNASELPREDMMFKFKVDVNYTQASGTKTDEAPVPKSTADIASAADLMNVIENHQGEDLVLNFQDDVDISSYPVLTLEETNTVVELNGHNITVAPNGIEVSNGATITFEDTTGNGTVTTDRGVVNVLDGGTAIFNGGNYVTTNKTRGSAIYAEDGAKIVINDGKFNAAYYTIGCFGSVDVTINGGELKNTATKLNGPNGYAYSVKMGSGKFTMNGGKVIGIHGALAIEGDTEAVINNGEIYVAESSEGANDAYYDIYIVDTATLTVNNGSLTEDGTRPIIYTTTTGDINLKGGIYKAKGTDIFNGSTKTNIKITGGTYSHDVTDYVTSGTLNFDSTTSTYKVEA